MQCDGYTAYKALVNPAHAKERAGHIKLAFCWSHLRRRFVEIVRSSPVMPKASPLVPLKTADAKASAAPTATEALSRIGQIYTVERNLRGRSAAERRAGRQLHIEPLVTALKTRFEERLKILSGKCLTAEAIRYGLNHWDGLIRFLDDGRIELDTNAVERARRRRRLFSAENRRCSCIAGRPIALNRKNALFAGCGEGAEVWAQQSPR